MAFVPQTKPSTWTSGAMSDALTSNALTVVGGAGLAGVGVMSLAVTATILPAQTIVLGGVSTVALVAGARQAQGKPIVPSFGGGKQNASDASVTPVTDTQAKA